LKPATVVNRPSAGSLSSEKQVASSQAKVVTELNQLIQVGQFMMEYQSGQLAANETARVVERCPQAGDFG